MKDIDYALVEETRPPIYTAMKYWGKKPHNIWREYVEHYTPEGGLYLDPFAGSCISAFEAVKAGKKAFAFDINPLSSFIVEVIGTHFDVDAFKDQVEVIIEKVKADPIYKKFYSADCPECKNDAIAQSFKWEAGKIYEVGIFCYQHGSSKATKSLSKPTHKDIKLAEESDKIEIPYWIPSIEFSSSPSFSASFIRNIGGNHFSDLWTRRNLYTISAIFNEILKVENEDLKKQLLFGFTQTIHLCTKMSIPRRSGASRPFSTSWGRSAYVCSSRQMEMNPLLVFKGSCFGKQSVESALSNVVPHLGKVPKIQYVDRSNRSNRSTNFDIKYGIIDVSVLDDYVDAESIDFILTDPPYGGLVQYLDLSLIWLVWLEKVDDKFKPNLDAEITVKRGVQEIDVYKSKFTNAMKKINKVLKPDGKMVITFHNKDLTIWNAFLNSVVLAGFKIEKVIHQQNRRTGESNVANPYGTSGTDFYIRCIKSPTANIKTDKDEFEHYVVTKATQLIALRNEPTPYQILFNGLLVEISNAGFDLQDFDKNLEDILSKHIGDIFTLTQNSTDKSGNYWWFKEPEKHIKYPDRQLADRVEETVIALLRRKVSVSFDEVLAEIFIKYPNGLTPTVKSVSALLGKYANKSNDKWVYKGGEIEKLFTQHTEILYKLSLIGRKLGYKVFIGRREQPEPYKGKKLSDYADNTNLSFLGLDPHALARVEMIDMVWTKEDQIVYAIEVENSTNFTSGIQRASNLKADLPKIMVVPDTRLAELKRIRDKLFIDGFKHYSWTYLSYTDVGHLTTSRSVSLADMGKYLRTIE